jgi:hypothetical protein
MVSLAGYYASLTAAELAEREDFVIYACELLRQRLFGTQLSRALGWDEADVRAHVLRSPMAQRLQVVLFARVVPNLKRLGLLTPRVREAFARLGILEFEDRDPEAEDRALAAS